MSITMFRNKDGTDDIKIEGESGLVILVPMIHKALYKLCYVHQITYDEALSIWESNPKDKLLKWSEKRLPDYYFFGKHINEPMEK